LGSARVSRAGERVLAIANFPCALNRWANGEVFAKFVSARRPFGFAQGRLHQHA
jgi:hypothetical protein